MVMLLVITLSIGFFNSVPKVQPVKAVVHDMTSSNIQLFDTNHNGKIELIKFNVSNPNFLTEPATLLGASPYGLAVTQAGRDITISLVGIVTIANPSEVQVVLNEADPDLVIDTDAVNSANPIELAYTPSGCGVSCIWDTVNDELNLIAPGDTVATDTEIDKAAPVPVSAVYQDSNSDGRVDRIVLNISSDVGLAVTYADGDWTVTPGTVSLDNETGITAVGDNLIISTLGAINTTGGAVNPAVAYNNNANNLRDGAGNFTATFAAVTAIDYAAPYPVSAVYKDAISPGDGTVDRIDITMTTDLGLACTFNADDWSIPTAGDINVNNPVSCTRAGNDLQIGVFADANQTGGTTNPTILYTNNLWRVRDGASNYTATFSPAVTATDAAAPVIIATSPANNAAGVDLNANIVITFSEPMTTGSVTYTLAPDPGGVAVAWSSGNKVATYSHTAFAGGTPYTFQITAGNASAGTPNALIAGPVPNPFSFTSLAAGGGRGASVVGTVVINNDAATTSNPNVTLTLTGTNATEMVIGNDPNFIGSSWETFATSKTWTLTSGDGVKTVYAKFKDSAGNLSQTASDTITRTLPTVSDEYSFVTASPISVVADGASQSTITADVRDGSNAPMSGKTVTISSSRGTLDTITTVTGTTGTDGVATFKVKSGTAGTSTFTATVDSVVIITAASVVFTAPGAPSEVPPGEVPVGLSVGDLIKSSISSTVYYYGSDNKRHIFPNSLTYRTWYLDWSGVKVIPQSQLQGIALGKNVTMRPGTVLVKIESDPKVYAVEPGGILRWIPTEARAIALYGPYWTKRVIDVPAVFWGDYTFGADITTDTHPTGALIQYAGLPDVYYIQGAEKRHIATESAFIANNFRWINVLTVPTAFYYSTGTDITGREPDLASIY